MLLQEMDAAAFKAFSSREWHIGVVSDASSNSRPSHLFNLVICPGAGGPTMHHLIEQSQS